MVCALIEVEPSCSPSSLLHCFAYDVEDDMLVQEDDGQRHQQRSLSLGNLDQGSGKSLAS